ncbi:hypothetical protein [Streptomyces microflavus]
MAHARFPVTTRATRNLLTATTTADFDMDARIGQIGMAQET